MSRHDGSAFPKDKLLVKLFDIRNQSRLVFEVVNAAVEPTTKAVTSPFSSLALARRRRGGRLYRRYRDYLRPKRDTFIEYLHRVLLTDCFTPTLLQYDLTTHLLQNGETGTHTCWP